MGLFRVWNVIEYYFPYIDVMDESWHDLLDEFIPKIVEENDRQGFELVLLEMTAHLHDCNPKYIARFLGRIFGPG